jgi:NitT/TauT family transport system ATP-binding protein
MFLNCINLGFSYNGVVDTLKNINLDINKGETLAIVGASGCGKSTLLRLISGILPNDQKNKLSGILSLNGKIPNDYIKTGKLAFMFQEPTLMPNLTVRENIAFPLKIQGIKDESKVTNLIQSVGLTDYADYYPKQLSGGMKTRVSLARSFVTNPEILLLDEPFSALDIAWKNNLYLELSNLVSNSSTTVIIVTHDIQEALLLASKVLVIDKSGSIIQQYNITSKFKLNDRLINMGDYIEDIYTDYFKPIQAHLLELDVKSVFLK